MCVSRKQLQIIFCNPQTPARSSVVNRFDAINLVDPQEVSTGAVDTKNKDCLFAELQAL